MAEKVSKVIPVAERITNFCEKNFRQNSGIVHSMECDISDEQWKEFAGKALVIINGRDILQYAEEYPIVKYQCSEKAYQLQPEYRLNSFVKSITVSTALSGKVISVISGKVTEEMADYDTVVYYEDNCGIYHAVMQNDICKFLLRKPSLIVSPEGMLVFFTGKAILATVDCEHYYWVDWKMDLNYKSIKCIKVCKDSCEITLIDEKSKESTFRLTFEFDISEHQMIEPIITEL